MKKIFFSSIFIFFVLSGLVLAQSGQEIYRKANLAYESEDYGKAVSLYKMLVKMDRVSPEVFYNLGNSYFKLKRIGKAIVNYERALRLAPRDRDILVNLKLAKGMAVDKIKVQEKGFLLNLILFPYNSMNIDELSVFVSIVYLSIVVILIFSIFFVGERRLLFYIAGGLGALLIIATVFLVSKIDSENFTKHAVIISKKVDVRSGPKQDYILQFTLHEGTILKVLTERQGWYEIDLSKDLRGWLPKDTVEII